MIRASTFLVGILVSGLLQAEGNCNATSVNDQAIKAVHNHEQSQNKQDKTEGVIGHFLANNPT